MLFGIPPFYCYDQDQMFKMIRKGKLRFPKRIQISSDCRNLIEGLLEKDPDVRLGQLGFEEIK